MIKLCFSHSKGTWLMFKSLYCYILLATLSMSLSLSISSVYSLFFLIAASSCTLTSLDTSARSPITTFDRVVTCCITSMMALTPRSVIYVSERFSSRSLFTCELKKESHRFSIPLSSIELPLKSSNVIPVKYLTSRTGSSVAKDSLVR